MPVTGGEPTLLVRNAAQATASGGSTYAFVRPVADFFGGSSIVLAGPEGCRKLADATWDDISESKMSPDGSEIVYSGDGTITVVDVSSEETSDVAEGRTAAWVDDGTLVVAPTIRSGCTLEADG